MLLPLDAPLSPARACALRGGRRSALPSYPRSLAVELPVFINPEAATLVRVHSLVVAETLTQWQTDEEWKRSER